MYKGWLKYRVNVQFLEIITVKDIALNSSKYYLLLGTHLSHCSGHFLEHFWKSSFVTVFITYDKKYSECHPMQRQTSTNIAVCCHEPCSPDLAPSQRPGKISVLNLFRASMQLRTPTKEDFQTASESGKNNGTCIQNKGGGWISRVLKGNMSLSMML